jgi:hypothetical protein
MGHFLHWRPIFKKIAMTDAAANKRPIKSAETSIKAPRKEG